MVSERDKKVFLKIIGAAVVVFIIVYWSIDDLTTEAKWGETSRI